MENVGEREVGCQKLHDMKRKEEPDKELKQRIGQNLKKTKKKRQIKVRGLRRPLTHVEISPGFTD